MPNSKAASRKAGFSPPYRDQFLATGVVHLPGVIPRPAAEAMADRLWDSLAAQHGILRHRPETWTKERPAQFRDLRHSGAFAAMASPDLQAVLDGLFGQGGWTSPAHWGQPLVTFPTAAAWRVPDAAWHLDIPPDQVLEPWPDYIRIFSFLAPLEPGGGGTVYVSGSHRVVMQMMAQAPRADRIRSASIAGALRLESPWIAGLCSPDEDPGRTARFMQEGASVRGVPLRVAEMTGEPGDIVLMHPGTLHSLSPNARRTPRLMLAESVYAKR
ncbi:MAG: hypothetical protein ACREE0_17370 [Phenylobacterium sp.]